VTQQLSFADHAMIEAPGVTDGDDWHPEQLPEPARTAVFREPALAQLAALVTVHRLHGQGDPIETRGRRAGLAYLEQRALQMAAEQRALQMAAAGAAARARLQPAVPATETGSEET
jgi:hypothetical protein